MLNDDLIAFLQPAPHRFDPHAWRDVMGGVNTLDVQSHRLHFRLGLGPGMYRGLIRTRDGAFEMETANVTMAAVPSGRKVSVGPWDLDHLHNIMAMPTARAWVNGRMTGGLWFTMPGPEDIEAGRLTADFGFEVPEQEDKADVVLEFVEHDRERISWLDMLSIELRRDDRRLKALSPVDSSHPRIFLTAEQLPALRQRLANDPRVLAIVEDLSNEGANQPYPFDSGTVNARAFARDALVGLLTRKPHVVNKVTEAVVALCERSTWSGRPDPLLMGGDNDRGIGNKLSCCALAWDYLGDVFTQPQRQRILTMVETYLRKMYDFTVLQRGYMGYPSSNAHSTGAWNGVAMACMAFYDDLAIARQALPLFHGLFVDTLALFPPGGKAKATTFTPWQLARYLAAANTFAGNPVELQDSAHLDQLGNALLACFRTPSTQDMQRGRRTLRHRNLTAFLSRFHPTPGIEGIYHAFLEAERREAGDVRFNHFDLLYAPEPTTPASFPEEPYFARDIGQVFAVSGGQPTVGININAGLIGGARASFSLKGHDRSGPQRLAGFELAQNGRPIVVDVSQANYGIDGALANTMCFESGGLLTQDQYLPGEVGPEFSASICRYYRGSRFVYVHALVGPLVDPKLGVRQAERIMVFDRSQGTLVINDAFTGERPLHYGTHLHVSGSITPAGPWSHRLSGGQANLIAGIKGGAKNLSNEEHGELYVSVLEPPENASIQLSEDEWIPPYIYGINDSINEDPQEAAYPHYQRWRLQYDQPVDRASLSYGLTSTPEAITADREVIHLPGQGHLYLAPDQAVCVGQMQAEAEAVLHDYDTEREQVVFLGTRRLTLGDRSIAFTQPVDIEWQDGQGACLASHPVETTEQSGFTLATWYQSHSINPRSHGDFHNQLRLD